MRPSNDGHVSNRDKDPIVTHWKLLEEMKKKKIYIVSMFKDCSKNEITDTDIRYNSRLILRKYQRWIEVTEIPHASKEQYNEIDYDSLFS